MKLKKAIKKIVAISTGAVLMGATIFGAMAADLADFPKPLFIDETTGVFDGIFVIGDNAATADVVGVASILGVVQAAAVKRVAIGDTTTIIEGDIWEVETSSKKLEFTENISSIKTFIGGNDLNALADGSFRTGKNTVKYEQELRFAGQLELQYEKDTDNEMVSDFLTLDSDDNILDYTITFKTPAETDIVSTSGNELEDFKNKKITMLGTEYTITKATSDSSVGDVELTLMSGPIRHTLDESETIEFTLPNVVEPYEVTLAWVNDNECKFKINGETTDMMSDGDSFKLDDGTEIAVIDVMENEGTEGNPDKVDFYFGSTKIVLKDPDGTVATDTTGTLEVGYETMDNVDNVIIHGSVSGGDYKMEYIKIIYKAENDYWIGNGEKLSEHIEQPEALFGWDIEYKGLTEEETVSINVIGSGDKKLILKTELGDGVVTIPLAYSVNATDARLGDANYRLIVDTTNNIAKNQYFFLTTGIGIPSQEGEKSYVLQYKGATSSGGDTTAKLKFRNLATKEDIERTFNIAGGSATLNLGGHEFTITNTSSPEAGTKHFNISIGGGADYGYLVTKGNALINITDSDETIDTDDIYVDILEVDPNSMLESGTGTMISTIIQSGTASEIVITQPSFTSGSFVSDPDDSNVHTLMTKYGALVKFTSISSSPNDLEIAWPNNQVFGQVYVTSGAITTSETSEEYTEEVQQIPATATKLASEVADATADNMILVGGPCANSVAMTVMGVTSENCVDGFEVGKAKIKLYEMTTGKIAMLVAGHSATDTRRACNVVANYKDYTDDLIGDEVEVTTLTDTPTVAEPVVETTTNETSI